MNPVFSERKYDGNGMQYVFLIYLTKERELRGETMRIKFTKIILFLSGDQCASFNYFSFNEF